MNNQELYQIAMNRINHKELKNSGISGHVACALETKAGTIYTGVCIDIPCSLGLCAEQAAIAEMVKNNETIIKKIVAVYESGKILPPCGKCREFIAQIDQHNLTTKVILPEMAEEELQELLPERWDYIWN
ncbi:cytidine deaminase family protein [Enterococcus sp. AZ192]|uniref:cytidine deaminase family protein n=1 Tax=unclassified Enterococcus TaxID=2608891 RepID=UPI003D2CDE7F